MKRSRSLPTFVVILAAVACGHVALEWIVFLPTRRYYFPDYWPNWSALLLSGIAWGAGAAMIVLLGRRIVARWNRRNRIARGLCGGCGYPLHDVPEAVPCPECGEQRLAALHAEGLERD